MSERCAHCGQPVARAVGGRDEARFCCSGCEAVWHALHEAGLESYYRLREDLPEPAALPPPEPSIDPSWLEPGPHGPRATFSVDGIHCASCAWVIEEVLRREPSVRSCRVALARERLTVNLRPDGDPADVIRALRRVGYGAQPVLPGAPSDDRARHQELLRCGVAAAGAMNAMLFSVALYGGERWGIDPALEQLFRWLSLLVTTPVVFWSAWPILRRAVAAVRVRSIHVDVPVAVAIVVMYGSSAWNTAADDGAVWFDSLAMLVALLLGGRLLEGSVRRRAGDRLSALVGRRVQTARRLTATGSERVAPEALHPGDRIELLPGDITPTDCSLAAGESDVDLSVVDGESRPRSVGLGDDLPAGAKILTGRLVGTVLRPTEAGSLAGLRRQVDDALERRAPVEQLADRIARWFVGAVLLIAAASGVSWWLVEPARALPITVAVLVVACPCALALATPLAFASAVHGAAARGLVVRSGEALLRLGRVDRVVFDKTGTLTEGRLVPGTLEGASGDPRPILRLAAAACQGSLHPVARGVVRAAREAGLESLPLSSGLREQPGQGLSADVEGHLVQVGRPGATIRVDGAEVGRVPLQDRPRHDAAEAVRRLVQEGVALSVLSGDEVSCTRAQAEAVGVSDARGALLPAEKAVAIRGFRAEGEVVAFVGDGLNDAPALAAADVGLAMGSAVDLSVEAADGALIDGGLGSVADCVVLGRRLGRTLKQNITLSVAYNLCAVSAAVSGLLSPLEAAALMPLSSLIVVSNAARLARGR